MKAIRVVFMGTGDICLPTFASLLESGEVVGLVTQPDRPVGRKQEVRPPRVKEMAVAAGVPVLQPERLRRADAREELKALRPDVVVVMAYGQILPKQVLDLPTLGCLNVHASLLPRYRGASCIQAAIDAGDAESGVTIMYMAEGLDTGDLVVKSALALADDETGGSLHDRLANHAPAVLGKVLSELRSGGEIARVPQDETQASYAPKLLRSDGEIDWSLEASELERRIRAYEPWPGTFTWFVDERGQEKRLKIYPPTGVVEEQGQPGEVLRAQRDEVVVGCGKGALRLREIQLDGGRRLSAEEFLTGHSLRPGSRLFSLGNACQ